MRIPFACPSCAAAGTVDASVAGRRRGANIVAVTSPSRALANPSPWATAGGDGRADGPSHRVQSAFRFDLRPVARRHATAPPRRPKRRAPESTARPERKRLAVSRRNPVDLGRVCHCDHRRRDRPPGPRGTVIAGCVLMALGSLMVLAGYGAGPTVRSMRISSSGSSMS